jgi:hypothetical protein
MKWIALILIALGAAVLAAHGICPSLLGLAYEPSHKGVSPSPMKFAVAAIKSAPIAYDGAPVNKEVA